MSHKELFFKVIAEKGFDVSDNFFALMSVSARHRKTPEGNHNIINHIKVVNFSGVNTKEGELGCVTFAFCGIERKKYHKSIENPAISEIIKKAFCPKSVKEAIDTYNEWVKESQKTMDSWEMVL